MIFLWLQQMLEFGLQKQDLLFMGLTMKAMESHQESLVMYLTLMVLLMTALITSPISVVRMKQFLRFLFIRGGSYS